MENGITYVLLLLLQTRLAIIHEDVDVIEDYKNICEKKATGIQNRHPCH